MKSTVKSLLSIEKPSRYYPYEFNRTKKDFDTCDVNICLSYPDSYEVGMSNIGIRILYDLLNSLNKVNCDRIFSPMPDMEKKYRDLEEDFVSIENNKTLKQFDILGFSFQYEMLYTNFLNILSLGEIPFYIEDRKEDDPIIIAGGPSVYNPGVLLRFADFIFIGEAEENIVIFVENYRKLKSKGLKRSEIIERLKGIQGVLCSHYPERTKRAYIKDLDNAHYPEKWVTPTISLVHDRAYLEIMRGCPHGCRFCQAGYIYRPYRFKSLERCKYLVDKILQSSGYEEVSLASLSTSDYPYLEELSSYIMENYSHKKVSISLPSLRINGDTIKLLDEILKVKKTGLTFACEAGTQRLRDSINKKINEDELIEKMKELFGKGWKTVKLYFMLGLPGEDNEEMENTVKLIKKCSQIALKYGGKRAKINASFSTFVPKPFTPYQWSRMININTIKEKIQYLKDNLRYRNINLKWHDAEMSIMEGIMSRCGSEMAPVIVSAFNHGARFDGWTNIFNFEIWKKAFKENGIIVENYLNEIPKDKELHWDIIDIGVKKDFLLKELELSDKSKNTPDCNVGKCTLCGVC